MYFSSLFLLDHSANIVSIFHIFCIMNSLRHDATRLSRNIECLSYKVFRLIRIFAPKIYELLFSCKLLGHPMKSTEWLKCPAKKSRQYCRWKTKSWFSVIWITIYVIWKTTFVVIFQRILEKAFVGVKFHTVNSIENKYIRCAVIFMLVW